MGIIPPVFSYDSCLQTQTKIQNHPSVKTSDRFQNYMSRLKSDEVKYKEYMAKKAQVARNKRKNMTEEQRQRCREKARLRQRKYIAKLKAQCKTGLEIEQNKMSCRKKGECKME